MAEFDLAGHHDTYAVLVSAYSENHRAYHTLDHIDACLRHLDAVRNKTTNPHEIEMALWFHDAVYKPFSKTNEEDSAELARKFLDKSGADGKSTERIYGHIILTKDHIAPKTDDASFMLDIDLSILGSSEDVYAEFEKDVRCEYKLVPSFIFRKNRKKILQSFLDRPKIYHTAHFFERFEEQARRNLSKAIESL